MNLNFELILFYATLISGVVSLVDILWLAKRRKQDEKLPWYSDYARSFFPVLLLVFVLRSFLYEPFRIPSGSLKPTLQVGDFILVNKFDYGIRLPVIHQKIFQVGEPERGDIVVFRWPPDPSIDFIKRIVGLPGDRIDYVDRILFINGHAMPQTMEKTTTDTDENGVVSSVVQKRENLLGIQHAIFQTLARDSANFHHIMVPQGMYFAMGDNRDASADSRYWGFVPEENIVGKAVFVWMSWDAQADLTHKIRWSRIGTPIH